MSENALRAPKQERSRKTLERIVRASLEILEEEGPDGLTVQAIITRADASVGSFYARFAGKDDLLDYLGDRVWREAAERWDRSLGGQDWSVLDLGAVVRLAVGLLAESGRSRARILAAIGRTPGVGADAYGAFREHVLHGLEGLLLERAGELDHPDPPIAVRVGLHAVLGVVSMLEPGPATAGPVEAGAGQERAIAPERLHAEAERLLLSYLTGSTSGRGDAGQMDFFDIWG